MDRLKLLPLYRVGFGDWEDDETRRHGLYGAELLFHCRFRPGSPGTVERVVVMASDTW